MIPFSSNEEFLLLESTEPEGTVFVGIRLRENRRTTENTHDYGCPRNGFIPAIDNPSLQPPVTKLKRQVSPINNIHIFRGPLDRSQDPGDLYIPLSGAGQIRLKIPIRVRSCPDRNGTVTSTKKKNPLPIRRSHSALFH